VPADLRKRTGEVICLRRPPGIPTKPFPLANEIGLKRIPATKHNYQTTGAVMLSFILTSIYREFRRSCLSGMRKHHLAR
jgi:hypothetical protein